MEKPKLIKLFIDYYPEYCNSDFMELVEDEKYTICNNYIFSVINSKLDKMIKQLK